MKLQNKFFVILSVNIFICVGLFFASPHAVHAGFVDSLTCFFQSTLLQQSCTTPAESETPETPPSTITVFNIGTDPQFINLRNAYQDLQNVVLSHEVRLNTLEDEPQNTQTIIREVENRIVEQSLPSNTNSFNTLTVSGGIYTNLDCSTYGAGGKLTTDASGRIICANDRRGADSSNSDDQTLSFNTSTNILTISGGNTVDLSSLSGGGGTSTIASLEDITDVANMAQTTGDLLYWNGSAWSNIATSSLGIGGAGHDPITLAGAYNYLTLSGQEITLDQIDLTTDVAGTLATSSITGTFSITSGGTGSTTASGARSNLGLVIGTDIQSYDANTTLLGSTINANELASEDFGDFTCNGTSCSLDATYLTSVDISDNTNLTVTATGLELSDDAVALSAGYSVPLTASTTEWTTAFGWGDHGTQGYLTGITGESIESLVDVSSMTPSTGDVLYWNGSSWINTSTSSLNISGGGGGGGGTGSSYNLGMVAAFATSTCPAGWLAADGSAVSRATYADLFGQLGVTYGNGDGSTTFNLPDYRGYFLRGWDNGAGNDPDAGSRTDRGDGTTGDNVGTVQADEFEGHDHTVDPPSTNTSTDGDHTHTVDPPSTNTSTGGGHTHTVSTGYTDPYGAQTAVQTANVITGSITTSSSGSHNHSVDISQFNSGSSGSHNHSVDISQFNSGSAGGNETRPQNINVLYCISHADGGYGGADIAELYAVADSEVEAGDVVMLDTEHPAFVAKATGNNALMGIVSTQPGITLDDDTFAEDALKVPVALAGRVPTKVTTENGIIQPGDRIAVSNTPGYGRKANAYEPSVGIAIDSYEPDDDLIGGGTVTVFVDLQEGINMTHVAEALLSTSTIVSYGGDELTFSDAFMLHLTKDLPASVVYNTYLISSSTATSTLSRAEFEMLWSRLQELANSFVDGILSVVGIKTTELCISDTEGSTCIDRTQLKDLLDANGLDYTDNDEPFIPTNPDEQGGDGDNDSNQATSTEGHASTTEETDTEEPLITATTTENATSSNATPPATSTDLTAQQASTTTTETASSTTDELGNEQESPPTDTENIEEPAIEPEPVTEEETEENNNAPPDAEEDTDPPEENEADEVEEE